MMYKLIPQALSAFQSIDDIPVRTTLIRRQHSFLGRDWTTIWMRNCKRSSESLDRVGEDQQLTYSKQIFLFAEHGQGLREGHTEAMSHKECSNVPCRKGCDRLSVLNWLLQFDRNRLEPFLKLFHRISLGRGYQLRA